MARARAGDAGLIDRELAARLCSVVGVRASAVHDEEAIDWEVVCLPSG